VPAVSPSAATWHGRANERSATLQFNDAFRSMGTRVDVIIETGSHPIDALLSVRLLFRQQEALFSRFDRGSLLSRANRGEAIDHAGFARACRMALEAYEFTGGLFNPMVLQALSDAGYDRSFESVTGGDPRQQEVPDPRRCIALAGDTVSLRTTGLDLGGVVKGWTVDLAAEFLADRYRGSLVNAGGDLRATGSEYGLPGWAVEVEAPDGGTAWEGTLTGALATSTRLRRRWQTGSGGEAHHLIDPRTGLPADTPAAQVSAWGHETWRAECWAKAVLIGGDPARERAEAAGYRVLALGPDGQPLACAAAGTMTASR
jgi:thiamine biosynthesis lipoprotein